MVEDISVSSIEAAGHACETKNLGEKLACYQDDVDGWSNSTLGAARSTRSIWFWFRASSRKSSISKFIEKFGAGVHHIAFSVNKIESALGKLTAGGADVDTPIITDPGLRQVFLRRYPASGVRVELIERKGGTSPTSQCRNCSLRSN
jgi:hypothetical protein